MVSMYDGTTTKMHFSNRYPVTVRSLLHCFPIWAQFSHFTCNNETLNQWIVYRLSGYGRMWCSQSFRIPYIPYSFWVVLQIIVNNSMAHKMRMAKKFMMLKNLWYKNGFAIEDLNSQWIFVRIYNLFVYDIAVMWIGYDGKAKRAQFVSFICFFFRLVLRSVRSHWETQWYRTNPLTTLTIKFYNVSDYYPIVTEHLSIF